MLLQCCGQAFFIAVAGLAFSGFFFTFVTSKYKMKQ
jgi:hypothetical protein